jgi:pimeloyl-ACP methyl ester carboxylesterase
MAQEYFPNAAHVDVEAGHWVQAEKPREFIQALLDFFAGKL